MEKFPILWCGKPVGEMTAIRQGLYTCYSVSCCLPGEGLWCVWAVGDRGELRIGVPEPRGERAVISRRFSDNGLQGLGTLRSVLLRPVGEEKERVCWTPLNRVEDWFRTPWLCGQLRGLQGVLAVREGKYRRVAVNRSGVLWDKKGSSCWRSLL